MLTKISSGVVRNFFSASKVTLPELKFGYAALEPVISSKLLETHHKKHHQAYVNNLNAALEQFEGKWILMQRQPPTSTTTRWQLLPRPLNSTWEDISTTPSTGRTWHPSVRVEANTLMKTHPSPSRLSANSVLTRT